MKVWFEIPTKSGVVRLEVPDLPASVGSDAAAEVRLKHPSVAPLHALLHESEDAVIISGVLPTHRLMYEGDEYRSLRLDDGDKMKIGDVPVLIRIEDDVDDEDADDEADADALSASQFGREPDSNDHDSGHRIEGEGPDVSAAATPPASQPEESGRLRLASIPPSQYVTTFLDESGAFQSWVTLDDADSVTSYFLLRYCADWCYRDLLPRISKSGCPECGSEEISHWPIGFVDSVSDLDRLSFTLPLEKFWMERFADETRLRGHVYALCFCKQCSASFTISKQSVPRVYWSTKQGLECVPETSIGPGIAGAWFLDRPDYSTSEIDLVKTLAHMKWPAHPFKYTERSTYERVRDTGDTYRATYWLKPSDLVASIVARRQRLARKHPTLVVAKDPTCRVALQELLAIAVALTSAWRSMIEDRNARGAE